jgi:hypothetical protein
LQRQLGGQQPGPQRVRPRGHFGVHVSMRCPVPGTLIRTHSVPFGQQTPCSRSPCGWQTCSSGAHTSTQTPLKQISFSPQQSFELRLQKLRPSSQTYCSPQSPPRGVHVKYQGQHEPG